jgi:hypothetical protein
MKQPSCRRPNASFGRHTPSSTPCSDETAAACTTARGSAGDFALPRALWSVALSFAHLPDWAMDKALGACPTLERVYDLPEAAQGGPSQIHPHPRGTKMPERSGGCLCGQVRYRLPSEPVIARLCWCRDCQHLAGNGTVNAIFPTQGIEVTGAVNEYTRAGESGNLVTRRFCPTCGSHLFADSTGRVGLTVVRVGTLDDPSTIKPLANIWAASAPSWACLDTHLERIERQPLPPRPQSAA